MIISDLNHIEVVSQEQAIVGAGGYYYKKPSAKADADAFAKAIGKKTYASADTYAVAKAGYFSEAGSSSYASAKGY
jgi:hypothetical protein